MTAPRFDRVSLFKRIKAEQAEIDALTAKLAARETEHRRLVNQLGRLPGEEPEPAPALLRRGVPLKTAETRSGRDGRTVIKHGTRLGFAWNTGGRWQIDLVGLDAWMAGQAAQS